MDKKLKGLKKDIKTQNKNTDNFPDITILSTPLPLACSTVNGKSIFTRKTAQSKGDESKFRQLEFNTVEHKSSDDTSLGILNNVSSLLGDSMEESKDQDGIDQHLCNAQELAQQLLQRCSQRVSYLNKENNANSPNLPKSESQHLYNSSQSPLASHSDNTGHTLTPERFGKKSLDKSTNAMFETAEITDHSSEFNKSNDKNSTFGSGNRGAISFSSTAVELMEQFAEEDFESGSRITSQLQADEVSWQNANPFGPTPATTNAQNRLELSTFSGILGEIDMTVDSHTGRRITVGEFFKRRCSDLNKSSERPNFGYNIESPQKCGKLRPLVDETSSTETSYHPDVKEKTITLNSVDHTKDNSIMSLSCIAQALEKMDDLTPRKLVDQIMDMKKKQLRGHTKANNLSCDTYTLLPATRSSLPFFNSGNVETEPQVSEIPAAPHSKKLSLQSKTYAENLANPELMQWLSTDTANDSENLQEISKFRSGSSLNPKLSTLPASHVEELMLRAKQLRNQTYNSDIRTTISGIHELDSKRNEDFTDSNLSFSTPMMPSKNNITDNDDTFTDSKKTYQTSNNQSFQKGHAVSIGKRTKELYTCIVGMQHEVDFEIVNSSDKWIVCSLKLLDMQGDKDNIQISFPTDDILINPNVAKSFKIGVKMLKMSKLIFANLQVIVMDMVTKDKWNLKHTMYFVPEALKISISTNSNHNQLDFQTVLEDSTKSLPVTLVNENSIDMPIIMRIMQENPQLFTIGKILENDTPVNRNQDDVHLILKSHQQLNINIDFTGIMLNPNQAQKGLVNAGKLLICFDSNERSEEVIGDISLVGLVGYFKLDTIDTRLPITLQPKQNKELNLINSGNVRISASATVIESKENQKECRDFDICPTNITFKPGEKLSIQIVYKPEKIDIERQAFIRITAGSKAYFYPLIGEKDDVDHCQGSDSFHSFHRSGTPQNLRLIDSPTSPHAAPFNKLSRNIAVISMPSGNSGRHSPGSSVSCPSVAGGIIPIRATHTALVWGSVKIGKTDMKEFSIRNMSNNKIKLQASITTKDQCFKFSERQSLGTSMIFSLQRMESKTLSVVFGPHSIGSASGKIIFTHYRNKHDSNENNAAESQMTKLVQMYGYGGIGKVEIFETLKDTSGQMWLSLGKWNSERMLRAKIKLQNTGDLTCFVKVKLAPKAVYPTMESSWYMEPTELLLESNQVHWINLEFRPRKEDLDLLQKVGVIHVGTLMLTHGDEPTRFRIRRLYNKLKETGQLNAKKNDHEDIFQDIVCPICKAFPGETFIKDLITIKDSVQNLGDLCRGVIQREVKVTVEVNIDETISLLNDNVDESQMFYSLCSDHYNESRAGESFMPK